MSDEFTRVTAKQNNIRFYEEIIFIRCRSSYGVFMFQR